MLTLLTPTRDRQAACQLLQRWLDRQTYQGPWHWVVVDDGGDRCGIVEREGSKRTTIIRRQNMDKKVHSLPLNLLAAAPLLSQLGGPYIVMEDDEWYGPEYVATMAKWLGEFEAVGESPTYDYNVKYRQWKVLETRDEAASFSRTGFTCATLPHWLDAAKAAAVKKSPWVDSLGWERVVSKKHLFFIHRTVQQKPMAVAMKGLPGPIGPSHGHQWSPRIRKTDPDMSALRRWMGDEYEAYSAFYQPMANGLLDNKDQTA